MGSSVPQTPEYSAPIHSPAQPPIRPPATRLTYDTVLKGRPAASTRYVRRLRPGVLSYTIAITGY